jgi:hypothetical protein
MTEPTRLPPEHTRRYGCENVHAVCLQHRSDTGGIANCVAIQIPEGQGSFDLAMKQARIFEARVVFICDTAGQARKALKRALKALPDHRSVSLELAMAGGWGLS